jgi:hypothetical protein
MIFADWRSNSVVIVLSSLLVSHSTAKASELEHRKNAPDTTASRGYDYAHPEPQPQA